MDIILCYPKFMGEGNKFQVKKGSPFTSKFGSFCDGHFDALATFCHGDGDEAWTPQTSHHVSWQL
jgi:hypothetical protein